MLFKEGSRVRNSDNVYRLITVCWALRRKRGDESHVPLSSRQAWDSKRNIGISWTRLEDDPGSVPQRRCPTRTNLALVKLRGLIISIQITNGEICQHEEHLKWGQKVAQRWMAKQPPEAQWAWSNDLQRHKEQRDPTLHHMLDGKNFERHAQRSKSSMLYSNSYKKWVWTFQCKWLQPYFSKDLYSRG